jgi:uncharacterized RDD family membrane protein YckC
MAAMSVDPAVPSNQTAHQAFGAEPMPAVPAQESRAASGALATWWPRAAALVLDGLILGVVGVAVALLVDSELLIYAIAVPISLLYAPLLMIRGGTRNGQTLGKQAMGIRVVREDGRAVKLGNALLRELIGRQLLIAVTLYVYALFDYLWPIWDKKNQALHDKVADTLVVLADSSAPGEQAVGGWLPPHAGA